MNELTLKIHGLLLDFGAFLLKRRKMIATCMIMFGLMLFFTTTMVHAFAAPAQGSTAYDIYDIFVNQILQGPIGFAASVGLIAFGIYMAVAQGAFGVATMSIIGGGILYRADTIVTSLGCMM